MTEPNGPSGTTSGEAGELSLMDEPLLDDLRQLHYADRAPDDFRERTFAAVRERSFRTSASARRAPFVQFASARLTASRDNLAEWASTLLRPTAALTRLAVPLTLVLGVAALHQLWTGAPRETVLPSAEPESAVPGDEPASNGQGAAPIARGSAPGWSSEPSCPQNIYPKLPHFDPRETDADVRSAGVTVHTFVQPTRSCGPITRRYLEYIPSSVPFGTGAPVVLILHAGPDRAENMRSIQTQGRFETLARRDGFIAVYASAVPSPDSDVDVPNMGRWQLSEPATRQVDDEAYLEQVLADLERRGVIGDGNAVFLVGHAEGALLALQAAAHRPDLYSGVAALMPNAESPVPAIGPESKLSRALFVALGEKERSVIHDWALALGITHAVIERARGVQLPDRAEEGNGYAGVSPSALRSRASRVNRVDLVSDEPQPNPKRSGREVSVRALFVSDNAGQFVPMLEADDTPRLVETFGFRNRDIDAVDEAWSFLSEALRARHQ